MHFSIMHRAVVLIVYDAIFLSIKHFCEKISSRAMSFFTTRWMWKLQVLISHPFSPLAASKNCYLALHVFHSLQNFNIVRGIINFLVPLYVLACSHNVSGCSSLYFLLKYTWYIYMTAEKSSLSTTYTELIWKIFGAKIQVTQCVFLSGYPV